jgi:hypothetical protein
MPSNFLIRKQGFALWIPIELPGYLLPGQRDAAAPAQSVCVHTFGQRYKLLTPTESRQPLGNLSQNAQIGRVIFVSVFGNVIRNTDRWS